MLPEPFLSWLHALFTLLRENDEKALFLLLVVEEAGVPLPMPGDLVIMFAGYRASMGEMTILEAGISSTLAVLMGSTLLYALSNKIGHGLLVRYGKFIHLDQTRLKKIEGWIQRRGAIMVLVGRLTPGLRTPTSIMAGVFDIPLHQFLFFAGLSAMAWSGFWLALGYYFGYSLLPLMRRYSHYTYYVAIVLIVVLGAVLLLYRRRGRREKHNGDEGTARTGVAGPAKPAVTGSPAAAVECLALAKPEAPDATG